MLLNLGSWSKVWHKVENFCVTKEKDTKSISNACRKSSATYMRWPVRHDSLKQSEHLLSSVLIRFGCLMQNSKDKFRCHFSSRVNSSGRRWSRQDIANCILSSLTGLHFPSTSVLLYTCMSKSSIFTLGEALALKISNCWYAFLVTGIDQLGAS